MNVIRFFQDITILSVFLMIFGVEQEDIVKNLSFLHVKGERQ